MRPSPVAALALRCVGWAAATAAALATCPAQGGALGLAPALAAGAAVGAVLFAVLAGGRLPRGGPPRRAGVARAAARAVVLGLRSAYEEALWRGAAFRGIEAVAGLRFALVVTTVAFALSHWRVQRWRMLVHLVTGAAFALAAVATGHLAAAMLAHATYNVLVGVAARRVAWRPVPGGRASRPGAVPAASTPVAEVRDVRKSFGRNEALRGVTLELHSGELLGLLGPNGAGKTTLLRVLVGLRRPDRGRARLFGRDPRLAAARASIGVTPQDASFPPTLRVAELLDLVRVHFRDPYDRGDLLERFGLAALARRQAGGLSGGERRRVAVALAFAGRPRAIFLDEPTTGLDVEARRAVWSAVRAEVESGVAVLLTSHQMDEVEALASRVAILARGRVVAGGTLDELRRRLAPARVRFRTSGSPTLRGAGDVVRDGDSWAVSAAEPEAVVAQLVASGVAFSDLEVSRASLEEAFLALVAQGRDPPA